MGYATTKAAIDAAFADNVTNDITPAITRTNLKAMIDALDGYKFQGVATPATSATTDEGKIMFFATEAGTYTNFNSIVVNAGEFVVLTNDAGGGWVKNTLGSSQAVQEYQHNDLWIKATGTGVTGVLVAGVLTVTVPSGVRLHYLRFNTNATDISGAADFTVRIDDQNGVANQGTVDTFAPPMTAFINRDNLSNDPPTSAFPFVYTQGDANDPQVQIVDYGSDQVDVKFIGVDNYTEFSVIITF